MKRSIIIMAACILAAASCTKMSAPLYEDGEFVFAPEFPGAGTTKATDSSFESGDSIGVYVTSYVDEKASLLDVSGNYANNVCCTFNGSAWTTSPKVYWQDGAKYDIYAYYPYAKPESIDEYRFSVAADQTGDGYAASDFLWTKTSGLTYQSSIPLSFKHMMSRIEIRFIKGEDYDGSLPDDADVYIHNTVVDAVVDMTNGDVVKNPYSSEVSISAHKKSSGVYEAIVVPQRITNRKPLIEICSNNVSYMLESMFVFKSGMNHIYNVTLTDNPEKVQITLGGTISSWGE